MDRLVTVLAVVGDDVFGSVALGLAGWVLVRSEVPEALVITGMLMAGFSVFFFNDFLIEVMFFSPCLSQWIRGLNLRALMDGKK